MKGLASGPLLSYALIACVNLKVLIGLINGLQALTLLLHVPVSIERTPNYAISRILLCTLTPSRGQHARCHDMHVFCMHERADYHTCSIIIIIQADLDSRETLIFDGCWYVLDIHACLLTPIPNAFNDVKLHIGLHMVPSGW